MGAKKKSVNGMSQKNRLYQNWARQRPEHDIHGLGLGEGDEPIRERLLRCKSDLLVAWQGTELLLPKHVALVSETVILARSRPRGLADACRLLLCSRFERVEKLVAREVAHANKQHGKSFATVAAVSVMIESVVKLRSSFMGWKTRGLLS